MSHRYTGDDDDDDEESEALDGSDTARRSGEDVDSDTTVTSRGDVKGDNAPANRPNTDDVETADEVADADTDSADAGSTERELPPILDVRESLDRIEREADADVSDQLDRVRSLLDEYEGRGTDAGSSGSSLVDDVDGLVVSMRERLSGDADRYAEGIENRLHIYRDSRNDVSETIHVSGAELTHDGGRVGSAKAVRGEAVTLDATLVNQGESRDGVVRVTFYDETHTPTLRVERRENDLTPDDHRQVSQRVFVPEDAEYFDISALDATETAASANA